MFHKTQGIVLSNVRYNDRYTIAHVFTRDFGKVSYLLPKSRGRKSKLNNMLFSPLAILNLEVEHLPLREIQRLKEAEREALLYEMGTDVTKVSLAFFLSEFLSKVLRETDGNGFLFDYIKSSIEILEKSDRGLANFHLSFLLGLTRFMGIYPNLDNYRKEHYFDLLHGEFVKRAPLYNHYLRKQESNYLMLLSRMNFRNMHLYKMSRNDRNAAIDYLLDYYRLHLYDFYSLKSLEVLREIHL